MLIPARLKVGGHVYEVATGHAFTERSDLCGQADHTTHHIRIARLTPSGEPRPRTSVEETFFHEMLHCVDEVYNSHELDEKMLTRLSEGLYAVLSDNGIFKD